TLMTLEAKRMEPYETGGVLMGYFTQGGTELVITDVIGPGPRAQHKYDSFVPDLDFQHREIARHYITSNKIHTYVADWHTHPRGALCLSRKDKQSLIKVARYADARLQMPAMILLAGENHIWDLAAFQLTNSSVFGTGRIQCVPTKLFGEMRPVRAESLQYPT